MRAWRAAFVSLIAFTFLSCSTSVEQQLIARFFYESRLRDLTALSKLSTIVFEPATDGIVTDFRVTGMAGSSVSKDVLISAEIKRPDGQIVSKRLAITIQAGLITKISERAAPPSTPPS